MDNSENPIQTLFLKALEIEDAQERAQFISQACGADSALRREVEELLRAHATIGQFLPEKPGTPARAALVGVADALTPGRAAPDLPVTEKPGDRIGRYKLLERIGVGGCGIVYMAEQEEPVRRRVALKVIKPGMDTREVIARFEAERQALALMEHPHIAKVFDGGATDTGRPYFVMELVRGIRITDYCDQKHFSTRQRLELFMQVCQAVQHAHQKGIIHRDLKPSNILVTVNDGVPVPKVIDFGIAKATGQRLTDKTLFTKFQQLIGTPAYMSPEQAEMTSVDIDTRSDIYSLGVLLYELLTGLTPFDAKELLQAGVEEILRTIREQEPPRPSKRLSTLAAGDQTTVAQQRQTEPPRLIRLLRGDLDWIVMKCLEKDRSRRYETANGLAMDVQRHLNNEPVLAGPPTAAYRLRKLARKYRSAVIIAAAFLVLLTAATGVSLWLAARANNERSNAVRAEYLANEAQRNAEQEALRANRERANALRAESAAKEVLTQIQIQRAEDFFVAEDSTRAVANLASVLTSDPSNRVAAARLLSALTFRNFSLPIAGPLRHEGLVLSAQFSPNGRLLVTASADGTARVWDSKTGKPLTEPLRHEKPVYSAQFSPNGQRIVTVSSDTARVWDAQTGKPLTEPFRHEAALYSAQFSPDGLRVAAACSNTVLVWDVQSGRELIEPIRHKSIVRSAQFSPDGRRIVTASDDFTAQVWDAQTGRPLTEPLWHADQVYSAQFSPDGLRVATASVDWTARVWDSRTGKPLTEPLRHNSLVDSAQFSPNGKQVITASDDRTAIVWDALTGKPLTKPLRHEAGVYAGQFSPDGLNVITASADGTAQLWDAQTGRKVSGPLRHNDEVFSAQFGSDGLRVVTASRDKTAWLWDSQSGVPLPLAIRLEGGGHSPQLSPDGLRVVIASTNMARVWDAQTGKPLTQPLQHVGPVWFAKFSPDGLRVVTASPDSTARVWDAQTGKPLTEPLRHGRTVVSAQFSPDGLRVVTASDDMTAMVWDGQTGKPLTVPLRHRRQVRSAHFSPDGLRVVTGSADKTARVWDARTGKPLTESLRHNDEVNGAQFSPDGRRVVTASDDRTARVWDAQTGKPVTEPLRHERKIYSAQFSPDGKRVVTASSDRTARVWDAQTGKQITEPLRHEDAVYSAQFSPDGLWVVTASGDRTGRVWDAQTGKQVTEPLPHEDAVYSTRFTPDGLRVVTVSSDNTVKVWEVPFGSVPVPPWLPQLAVSATGKRLTQNGVLEPVAVEEFLKLREQLSMAPATNFYTRWAKWFFADRATRTISPLSSITVLQHVQRRIEENTLESLREAIQLSPTNALAFARLARLAQDAKDNPRRIGEADFFSRRAIELSPNDPEILRLRKEVLDRISDGDRR